MLSVRTTNSHTKRQFPHRGVTARWPAASYASMLEEASDERCDHRVSPDRGPRSPTMHEPAGQEPHDRKPSVMNSPREVV